MKFHHILSFISCLLGFVYHFQSMAVIYFSYQTTSQVDIPLDHHFNKPTLVLCIRLTDILDRRVYLSYNTDVKHLDQDIKLERDKLSVNDIFELTPKAYEIMTGCRWRNNNIDLLKYNNKDCSTMFKIIKYLDGMFVCYEFLPVNFSMDFECSSIYKSLFSPSEIYSILLNESLTSKADSVSIISFVASYDLWNETYRLVPHVSRRFAYKLERFSDKRLRISNANHFMITNEMYTVNRLPSPYVDPCIPDTRIFDSICYRNCSLEVYKDYDMISPNELFLEEELVRQLKQISLQDMKNVSLMKKIDQKLIDCKRKCQLPPCNDWYSVTTVQPKPTLFDENSMALTAVCSQRPPLRLAFTPQMNTFEFIIYTCSCLGIWFGVSVLSICQLQTRFMAVFATRVKKHKLERKIMPNIIQLRDSVAEETTQSTQT